MRSKNNRYFHGKSVHFQRNCKAPRKRYKTTLLWCCWWFTCNKLAAFGCVVVGIFVYQAYYMGNSHDIVSCMLFVNAQFYVVLCISHWKCIFLTFKQFVSPKAILLLRNIWKHIHIHYTYEVWSKNYRYFHGKSGHFQRNCKAPRKRYKTTLLWCCWWFTCNKFAAFGCVVVDVFVYQAYYMGNSYDIVSCMLWTLNSMLYYVFRIGNVFFFFLAFKQFVSPKATLLLRNIWKHIHIRGVIKK